MVEQVVRASVGNRGIKLFVHAVDVVGYGQFYFVLLRGVVGILIHAPFLMKEAVSRFDAVFLYQSQKVFCAKIAQIGLTRCIGWAKSGLGRRD